MKTARKDGLVTLCLSPNGPHAEPNKLKKTNPPEPVGNNNLVLAFIPVKIRYSQEVAVRVAKRKFLPEGIGVQMKLLLYYTTFSDGVLINLPHIVCSEIKQQSIACWYVWVRHSRMIMFFPFVKAKNNIFFI